MLKKFLENVNSEILEVGNLIRCGMSVHGSRARLRYGEILNNMVETSEVLIATLLVFSDSTQARTDSMNRQPRADYSNVSCYIYFKSYHLTIEKLALTITISAKTNTRPKRLNINLLFQKLNVLKMLPILC